MKVFLDEWRGLGDADFINVLNDRQGDGEHDHPVPRVSRPQSSGRGRVRRGWADRDGLSHCGGDDEKAAAEGQSVSGARKVCSSAGFPDRMRNFTCMSTALLNRSAAPTATVGLAI